ncbi:MAG TPA: lytic transglycosylase domain-containing protein [Dongiaceae bacterium]
MNLDRTQRGWRQKLVSAAIMAVLFSAGVPALDRPAFAQEATAALPGTDFELGNDALPQPLEEIDADRYRQIFKLQAAGDFRGSDELIADLSDSSLLGHVLAARYLSPSYRSSPKELADWLKLYSALPDADQIYSLARRKGASAAALKKPQGTITRTGTPDEASTEDSAYFLSGLANWRSKRFDEAATAFTRSAQAKSNSDWDRSAAAFWAARAFLRDQRPELVSKWLREASKFPRTFYGQLAQRALGIDPDYDWNVSKLTDDEGAMLLRSGSGKRALSLIQVGQIGAAEKELLLLANEPAGPLDQALLAVSQAAGLPSLALKVGSKSILKGDEFIDAAMYPLPAWAPKAGYTVDRALLFAIMRQESGFNPNAASQAGAVGLMQLMPDTAKLMTGNAKTNLQDPQASIGIGQRYILSLLQSDIVKNDLFMLAASYNAGPGSVQKWKSSIHADDDPLLFVESIPSRETRLFVERIMAGYWIYQDRLSQNTGSLDAVASGAWPIYDRQDKVASASH